jgi:hypothetical protein
MDLLSPNNYNYIDVPYDSTVYIELFYDQQCVKDKNNEDCFTVHLRSNGTDLTFDACKDDQGNDVLYCPYKKFFGYLDSIMVPLD